MLELNAIKLVKAHPYIFTSLLAIIFILVIPDGSLLTWLLGFFSMIVHEAGHSLFAALAAIPSIPFFFVTFTMSDKPVIWIALALIAAEVWLLIKLSKSDKIICKSLLVVTLLTHSFFLIFPNKAVAFFIIGGLAGEVLIPIVATLISLELFKTNLLRKLIVFFILHYTYWKAVFAWMAVAAVGKAMPYPRDGHEGGVFLFQDPFAIAEGKPSGDLDKLIKLHNWSEDYILTYMLVVIAISIVALMLGFFAKYSRNA